MSEKHADHRQSTNVEVPPNGPSSSSLGKRFRSKSAILAGILFVVVLLAAAYGLTGSTSVTKLIPNWGKESGVAHKNDLSGTHLTSPPGRLESVFFSGTDTILVSRETVLGRVGRTPVDPSRILFTALEKKVVPDETSPKSCPPGLVVPEAVAEAKKNPSESQELSSPEENRPPNLGDRPKVVTKKPQPKPATKSRVSKPKKEASPEKLADLLEDGTEAIAKKTNRRAKKDKSQRDKQQPKAGKDEKLAALPKTEEAPDPDKVPEKYQLPGSLVVSIRNYKGDLAKWGLMVVLDDSISMARKSKQWDPNRMKTALTLVRKVSAAVPPGSRIAVRDFYCSKPRSKSGRRARACLSHMLFPWTGSPFKGLKAKLEAIGPVGSNNPCLAAAYSLKKDFPVDEKLTPRLLIVTSGITRCRYPAVLKSISRNRRGAKVRVDVMALGISRNRKSGYLKLAKNTGGVYLKVNKPSDVGRTVARYKKVLRTRSMKDLEVIGDGTALKAQNGSEITLAPGIYSVVLPEIPGLKPSKRKIKDIKIKSGRTKRLKVTISKGRVRVRASKL
ncbi:hypothetical protein ACFL2Q_04530 [Thermodesulfobacteriota bacterium]